ncbi:MAG: hypothetical protein OEM82_12190 [Acidobacteriota bacterium]|nr:hypothetical protein [Acidobacteriota bacterium]MDH3529580.1 hypothetical protein [Acidobacteriota bacterium]
MNEKKTKGKSISRKTKVVVGIFLVAILATVSLVGLGVYGFYSILSDDGSGKVPKSIERTGVLKGEGVLKKTTFFELEKAGLMDTVRGVTPEGTEGDRKRVASALVAEKIFGFDDLRMAGGKMVAASQFGVFVFDSGGKLESRKFFQISRQKVKAGWFELENEKPELDNLRIVRLSREKFGFLALNSISGVTVYDENANVVWRHAEETPDLGILFKDEKERDRQFEDSEHVLEAAVGDLDGDGISEYLVARKNVGLQAFSAKGEVLWTLKQDYPSARLFVFDSDVDGKAEVMQIGERLVDGTGNVVREVKSSGIPLVGEDALGKRTIWFCEILELNLTCMDESGEKTFNSPAPLSEVDLDEPRRYSSGEHAWVDSTTRVANERLVWVRLRKGEPMFLASVGSFIGIPRTNLYLYDFGGNLIFHEVLADSAEAISTVPNGDGTEAILVGGKSTIWKYEAGELLKDDP